jgi:hypothetical protein
MRQFVFDTEHFKTQSKERQEFYKDFSSKPITEIQFVAIVRSWPKKKLHNSRTRSASSARRDYRYLVRTYGFFPGGQS